jgi:hypothetical protein
MQWYDGSPHLQISNELGFSNFSGKDRNEGVLGIFIGEENV